MNQISLFVFLTFSLFDPLQAEGSLQLLSRDEDLFATSGGVHGDDLSTNSNLTYSISGLNAGNIFGLDGRQTSSTCIYPVICEAGVWCCPADS